MPQTADKLQTLIPVADRQLPGPFDGEEAHNAHPRYESRRRNNDQLHRPPQAGSDCPSLLSTASGIRQRRTGRNTAGARQEGSTGRSAWPTCPCGTGPSLVIEYDNETQLPRLAELLEGQLTTTLEAEPGEVLTEPELRPTPWWPLLGNNLEHNLRRNSSDPTIPAPRLPMNPSRRRSCPSPYARTTLGGYHNASTAPGTTQNPSESGPLFTRMTGTAPVDLFRTNLA